jgi:hypothetical protein
MTLTCHLCIDGVNTTFQSVLRSCFYLAKRVFPGFGSCNGHVTAITYGAELNVGGKSRTLGSVCLRILLLFCCYCSTLQHCSVPNVGVLYTQAQDAGLYPAASHGKAGHGTASDVVVGMTETETVTVSSYLGAWSRHARNRPRTLNPKIQLCLRLYWHGVVLLLGSRRADSAGRLRVRPVRPALSPRIADISTTYRHLRVLTELTRRNSRVISLSPDPRRGNSTMFCACTSASWRSHVCASTPTDIFCCLLSVPTALSTSARWSMIYYMPGNATRAPPPGWHGLDASDGSLLSP